MQQDPVVIWSASAGIAGNTQLLSFIPNSKIKKIRLGSIPRSDSYIVGWGNKPNTHKAKKFSDKYSLPYVRLEDGFISFLGHPSTDKTRLSLIQDAVGIYYDARHPSRLEELCCESMSYEEGERADLLIRNIISSGASKYNHTRCALPKSVAELGDDCILVVDQTANDQSIIGGLANADSFQVMLRTAIEEHPDKNIIIKTHPDVLISGLKGNKKGHFSPEGLPSNVHLLTVDCSIPALLNKVSDVYAVTSQLGFEALLHGKNVHCFGMPFYAGWGLTNDFISCSRRQTRLSLSQLVHSALIRYPLYLHPETNALCEVEEVVDWLGLQIAKQGVINICYAFGFSFWKRAFIKQFVGRMASQVVFINNKDNLEQVIKEGAFNDSGPRNSVLLWGRSRASWANTLKPYTDVWFMEDGFLRSVGLGADLRRPSCLVIDRKGMYYDAQDGSDIVDICNDQTLSQRQINRAKKLIILIKEQSITKYNVGRKHDVPLLLSELREAAAGRDIIVVPGQFENDLSIACSLGNIKTNFELLKQVRSDHPNAYIIFKEHPDVYSGVRPGALGADRAAEFSDLYLADIDMDSLLQCCDRLCTLTSLAGFEALLRGKEVTVYGSPFYAGWGLTTDKVKLPERKANLSLPELVYAAMIEYSRYVDWSTGCLTGPEQAVLSLSNERSVTGVEKLNSGWLSRQGRKVRYFLDAMMH